MITLFSLRSSLRFDYIIVLYALLFVYWVLIYCVLKNCVVWRLLLVVFTVLFGGIVCLLYYYIVLFNNCVSILSNNYSSMLQLSIIWYINGTVLYSFLIYDDFNYISVLHIIKLFFSYISCSHFAIRLFCYIWNVFVVRFFEW
jgi:hypothetical protein